jgi:hypothetical protein
MEKRGRPPKLEVAQSQVGLRFAEHEMEVIRAKIREAEDAAGLVRGSISPATYIRSITLRHVGLGSVAQEAVAATIGEDEPVKKSASNVGESGTKAPRRR